MKISRGVIDSAQKVCVYGPEGIGKTTFASQFPDPVFIDTEGSTKHLDVLRTDPPTSWAMLMQLVDQFKAIRPGRTLVIDTADWAERLAKDAIVNAAGKSGIRSIEDFGYGKGYTFLSEEWGKLLNKLSDLVDSGINVVLTAHAQMRKFEQPDEMGAYDRWELKLEKKAAPMTKEWADMVLFANYETTILTDSKTQSKKAVGGDRVMYTTHHPARDAKNRANLPEKLPFEFSSIAHLFGNVEQVPVAPAKTAQEASQQPEAIDEAKFPVVDEPTPFSSKNPYEGIPKPLADLMESNAVTEEDISEIIYRKGYFPKGMKIADLPEDFVNTVLVAAWPQVYQAMLDAGITVPF